MEWWRHFDQKHSARNLSPIFELPHDPSRKFLIPFLRRQVNPTYSQEWSPSSRCCPINQLLPYWRLCLSWPQFRKVVLHLLLHRLLLRQVLRQVLRLGALLVLPAVLPDLRHPQAYRLLERSCRQLLMAHSAARRR
jgi:hypothetical protein